MQEPKPTVIINHWYIEGNRLHGETEGHPRHADGTKVITSTILKKPLTPTAGTIVETKNTMYTLGNPVGE